MLAPSVAAGSWRTQIRTQRAKVNKAGESDDPEAHGVDGVATIQLGGERALDTWVSERGIKQRADQKSIGQPTAQEEGAISNDSERLVLCESPVSNWPGGCHVLDARELAIINEGNGLNIEGHCDLYSHKREHGRGVGYESPLDRLPSAVDRVEQRGHALEGQCGHDP